jgi:N12 class adenine-specific DNA methylase
LPPGQRRPAQKYDYFTAQHGPINKTTVSKTAHGKLIGRMPNMVTVRDDPDTMLVMSLKEYDKFTGKAANAAIMKQEVVGKRPPVTTVNSAEEGVTGFAPRAPIAVKSASSRRDVVQFDSAHYSLRPHD